ncbi:MAG: acid phosphatase, partial [Achromobacter sp.]|nr:acid phosphatase [Achromobacter sp.]
MLAKLRRKAGCALFLSLGIGAALASGAGNEPDPAITDPHFQLAPGYLPKERLPDSLELLGPPPAAASSQAGRGTSRIPRSRTRI